MTSRHILMAVSAIALTSCSHFRHHERERERGVAETAVPVEMTTPATETADLATLAGAPLFEGMGDFHREITTASPDAQAYFDQGMVLAFGFNHAESIRSFRAAQTLDPDCAMCFWGEALATGPNINVTSKGKAVMSEADRVSAFAAINKAVALKDSASPDEQALIAALDSMWQTIPRMMMPPPCMPKPG